ncbi:hypothetical protein J6590_053298 [Homalodisca vitripennis]|nr:hypothetical protein J6590_053298 [Homalodisca vitripennis]
MGKVREIRALHLKVIPEEGEASSEPASPVKVGRGWHTLVEGARDLETMPFILGLQDHQTTPCDFFLWGYVKEKVFVPPLTHDIEELKNRITVAIRSVNADTLCKVYEEFSYRLDIVRAAAVELQRVVRIAFKSLQMLTLPSLYISETTLLCMPKSALVRGLDIYGYETRRRDNYRTGKHRTAGVQFINRLPDLIKKTAPTPKVSKTLWKRLLASNAFYSVDNSGLQLEMNKRDLRVCIFSAGGWLPTILCEFGHFCKRGDYLAIQTQSLLGDTIVLMSLSSRDIRAKLTLDLNVVNHLPHVRGCGWGGNVWGVGSSGEVGSSRRHVGSSNIRSCRDYGSYTTGYYLGARGCDYPRGVGYRAGEEGGWSSSGASHKKYGKKGLKKKHFQVTKEV